MFFKTLHYAVRGYRARAGPGRHNTGITKRLKIIKENHPDIENTDVTEDTLDNLESGIVSLNKRTEKNPSVAEFKKIERKFFKKESFPNLLTWSEKEQIRFLFNSDPKTWSPDKLSECFPATIETIKKLIKSQWKPMTSERILHHDATVKDNWKAFESGHLKLPHLLNEYIKTFVSRRETLNLPTPDKSLQVHNSSTTSSEFLDIVKNFKNKSPPSDNLKKNEYPVDDINFGKKGETYVLNQKDTVPLKHKYYTLQQLKKELSSDNRNSGSFEIKNSDNDNFKESQPKVDSELYQPLNVSPFPMVKKNITETTMINENIDEIPLKISIPKDKMVKSKTHVYKVKDCYYDSNGEFLYKVPGMV